MQLLILGCHRSGTSAVTRIVNMMGAYFGAEGVSIGFNEENPKGFWERRDVVDLNHNIMARHTASWCDFLKFDPSQPLDGDLAHQMQSLILDMDAHRPWVMKDPRLCLTLPYWKQFLEIPVGVIVYRNPLQIAKSLEIRNKIPFEYGIALWEYYSVQMFNSAREFPNVFVDYGDVIANPVAATGKLCDDLLDIKVQGLRMPREKEITAFIEPKLLRSNVDDSIEASLNAQQQKLVEYYHGESLTADLSVSDEAIQILQTGLDIPNLINIEQRVLDLHSVVQPVNPPQKRGVVHKVRRLFGA